MTMQSLAMAVTTGNQASANAAMAVIGRGPDTFTVPAQDKATGELTGYVAHTFDDALAALLAAGDYPDILYRVEADGDPQTNIAALLDAQGWELVPASGLNG